MSGTMRMTVPADFELATTVCSYGYFILAPNVWQPATQVSHGSAGGSLRTRLRDAAGEPVAVRITETGKGDALRITTDRPLSGNDRAAVRSGIRRMLRLDEDLTDWWALHPEAAARRWGRLIRSASLFEDIVRTLTACNITWTQTVRMNARLCETVGEGAGPTPEQLARCSEGFLKEHCRTGYRAGWLVALGRAVAEGRLDLDWMEQPEREVGELYAALRQVKGVGDYAARNILQHLGRYDRVAVDSELVRHFHQRHAVKGTLAELHRAAADHYSQYAPYQFLAYWWELWTDYERRFGPAETWGPGILGAEG